MNLRQPLTISSTRLFDRPASRWRARGLTAALVAAAVLPGCTSEHDLTSSASVSTSASPYEPEGRPAELEWNLAVVPDDSPRHGGVVAWTTIESETASRPTILVGWVADSPTHDDVRPAIWRVTADGVALVTDSAFGDNTWLSGVAVGDGRLFAVGYRIVSDRRVASVWEAPLDDLTEWTATFSASEESELTHVTVVDGAVFAAGTMVVAGSTAPAVLAGTAVGWDQLRALETNRTRAAISGIAAGSSGGLLIVGNVWTGDDVEARSWLSGDNGRTWASDRMSSSTLPSRVTFVGSHLGEFIAAGAVDDSPKIWKSANGTNWSQDRLGTAEQIETVTISSMVVDDDGSLVLGGRVETPDRGTGSAIMRLSEDGSVALASIGPVEQVSDNAPLLFRAPEGALNPIWIAQPVAGSFVIRDFSKDPTLFEPGGAIPAGGPQGYARSTVGTGGGLLLARMRRPVPLGDKTFGPVSDVIPSAGGSWGAPVSLREAGVAGVLELADTPNGIVAVAVADNPDGDRTDLNDILIVALDDAGRPTSATRIDEPHDQAPTAFLVDGSTWWLAGSELRRESGAESVARMWTSRDGVAWTAATGPFEEERTQISDLCRTEWGVLAVGSIGAERARREPAAWIYRPDSGWTPIPVESSGDSSSIATCAEGSRTLAGGYADDEGVLWTLQADDADSGLSMAIAERLPEISQMWALAQFGQGAYLIGKPNDGLTSEPVLLASDDFTTWRRIELPGVSRLGRWGVTEVTFDDDAIRVLGYLGRSAAVWSASTSNGTDESPESGENAAESGFTASSKAGLWGIS